MSDDAAWSAVVRWVAQTTDQQVIRAHQEGHRPALPYVMVNLIKAGRVREFAQTTIYTDDSVEGATAYGLIPWRWHFSVHAFGEGCETLLARLGSALDVPQAAEPLTPTYALERFSDVRRLPERINEQWEWRAQIDLYLVGSKREAFSTDLIETVPLPNVTRV